MILDSNSKKPNIDYPCNWQYKVIGTDVDQMIKTIEEIVEGMEFLSLIHISEPTRPY